MTDGEKTQRLGEDPRAFRTGIAEFSSTWIFQGNMILGFDMHGTNMQDHPCAVWDLLISLASGVPSPSVSTLQDKSASTEEATT